MQEPMQQEDLHGWFEALLAEERDALRRRHALILEKLRLHSDEVGMPPPKPVLEISGEQMTAFEVIEKEPVSTSKEATGKQTACLKRQNSVRNTNLASAFHGAEEQLFEQYHCLHPSKIVKSYSFEVFFAVLIILNTLVMAVETVYSGDALGHKIGYPRFDDSPDKFWGSASNLFENMELVFGIFFCIEIILKILGLGKDFMFSFWNWFDAALVVCWLVEQADASLPIDTNLLRIVRLARLLRLVRIARKIQGLDSLVVMTTALQGSVPALFWTVILLLSVQMLFALLLGQVLALMIEDESVPLESRMEMFKYFGNFPRGMLTMFELTLGNFAPVARMLQEDAGPGFVIFSILHKVSFGFACIAVVNGVFMSETFKVASADDTIMLRSIEQKNRQHKKKMMDFMYYADHSGDGRITDEEWHVVLQNENARNWFAGQGLSIEDSETLFQLLEEGGDGTLDAEELSKGVARLQGPARSLDVCHLRRDQVELQRTVDVILAQQKTVDESLEKLASALENLMNDGSERRALPESASQKHFELKVADYLKANTNVEVLQNI